MDGLTSVAAGGDWSYGGSILTFAFPMILFIAVAAALYVLYTKPHMVPGHRYRLEGRTAVTTPAVGMPGQQAGEGTGQPASAEGGTGSAATGAEDS